jgi:hypothetical protein
VFRIPSTAMVHSHVSLLLAAYDIFYNVVDNIVRSLNERSAQFDLKISMSKVTVMMVLQHLVPWFQQDCYGTT